MKFIKKFSEISINDIGIVGGKNASIGQMIQKLTDANIKIPLGFATTANSYWYFMESNKLIDPIDNELGHIKNIQNIVTLTQISKNIRKMIEASPIPKDLVQEIKDAYSSLSQEYNTSNLAVAVRSSATAEDLPTASFAGQQESFLNIIGPDQLLESYKKCVSSLFTARAIAYRIEHGFENDKIALSVGIQKMVEAKIAGVSFTLDPETGFNKVVTINSSWGLGETVVQGIVNPDTYYVYKPTLAQHCNAIIRKQLGNKKQKIIYGKNSSNPTVLINTTAEEFNNFSLSQDMALKIAQQSVIIEEYYKKPMDIEWTVDNSDTLYIVQARPETVQSQKDPLSPLLIRYKRKENPSENRLLVQGQSIGQAIVSGKARVITSIDQIGEVQQGEILVTHMTDPDWVPIMRIAAGIVTNVGGRTCHAAIVSRELGIPAIVGANEATSKIKTGETISLDCSQGEIGYVYQGQVAFEKYTLDSKKLGKQSNDIMLNISDPSQAFSLSFLPVAGVGLTRIEFIFANSIKLHPMALIEPKKVIDQNDKEQIAYITRGYRSGIDYFIDTLAQEIATIAAAFNPRPIIVRFSDLKSNEYRNLIAGKYFEPKEENPMLGLRGASRYYNPLYEPAFRLECKAIKKILTEMCLENIKLLIPFVRTTQEAEKVLTILRNEGLDHTVLMMCEIPSNVILIDEFAKLFDGFSIGSNDLTQFTLAIDRDSSLIAELFNERNAAVKKMMELAIIGAHQKGKTIGICGQAPSDFPEIRDFLRAKKIDSISLNPESAIEFLLQNQ
ncbi:hypothetical protein A3F06_04485 [candidate division TM6 bacterium RIFCSPHIGHO2_12_FULL_36_22]|nr:MAG: hypothetical protein A3F06_04485 [candidate division TM6 bacterium RIFCSPHIGHO2_12_FULL_36_22]